MMTCIILRNRDSKWASYKTYIPEARSGQLFDSTKEMPARYIMQTRKCSGICIITYKSILKE